MEEFTLDELLEYNGTDGKKAYVAYNGKVYDVTDSFLWDDGDHQGMHEAGKDYSSELGDEAPHGDDVLEDFPVVGTIKK
ncbi:cytochrome b5 domain-containing protein [Methanosalsum natronophilum]|uniref:Cytochrome B5 n=1 Tax=Methanosalsum natronophilum TaxID=768733 RepID=A0A424YU14_9EURY|nr:cytochrome b5 domain-containing protein [Methanosalsum natronophilum]MCS3924360.1 putative heme/steroid binding protein [Methanosalsum natronophilum]RQD82433.1 MAG: cytochrome B5 [Methanosalsum natronophilum]